LGGAAAVGRGSGRVNRAAAREAAYRKRPTGLRSQARAYPRSRPAHSRCSWVIAGGSKSRAHGEPPAARRTRAQRTFLRPASTGRAAAATTSGGSDVSGQIPTLLTWGGKASLQMVMVSQVLGY
jgi:hypothetical protein